MDAYKVGVSIVLANGVSPVLAIIGRDLLGVNTHVGAIEKNFGKWSIALAGVGAMLGGAVILGALVKIVDKTKDFSDELVKLERLGGAMTKAVQSGEMTKRAFDISNRVPMNVTDLLKIPGAAYSIMGKDEADKAWEPLAKFAWVMQSQKDYKGEINDDMVKVLRAGELSGRLTDPTTGQFDPTRLQKYLDLVSRITAATHGVVNPGTLLGQAQQGGFALRGLSDEGFYTQAILAQAMGGPRSGTALLSLWQQLAGGSMLKRTAEGMQEMGFLKSGEWSTGKGGHVEVSDEASKRLTKLIGKDPLDFAAQVVDAMKQRGITDPEEQMRAVMRMTGRQTTQRYTAEEVTNFHQMLAERDRLMGGMGAGDSFKTIQDKSVSANMEALSNAWSNLLTAIAGPNSETIIAFLKQLTEIVNSMKSYVAGMDPKTVSEIVKVIAAIGIGLVALGAISLIALAGLPALIAAGVAAIATLAVLEWQRIKDMFEGIRSAIANFIDGLVAIWEKAKGLLNAIPGAPPEGGYNHFNQMKKPVMFMPGAAGAQRDQYAFSLNIDGDRIAQTIIDKIESRYRYDTNTPAFNGAGSYGA